MVPFDLDRGDDLGGAGVNVVESGSSAAPFEADTVAAVSSVRSALGALVAELPGEIRRPRQLQRVLGVDYKICWQVFNVIQAGDPLVAAKHTPSASALKRFLASGLELGIPRTRVEAVQAAVEEFGRVVRTHAEDRNMFHSMVAAVADDDGDASLEHQHRRTTYRMMSHIWGAQVEAHLAAGFVKRASNGTSLDECLITLKQGFRRLRPNVSPIVYGSRHTPDTLPIDTHTQLPLDLAAARKYNAPLVPEFCSRPLPKLRTVAGGDNWVYTKLATEGIGRTSKVDLAFGVSWKNTPCSLDETGAPIARAGMTIRTPTAVLILDHIIHRPSFKRISPVAVSFQNIPGDESPVVSREAPQLHLSEKVRNLGRADQVIGTPEWPRYPELLRFAADRLKYDLREFDVVRLRVEYPVFSSVVRIQFRCDE